MIDSKNDDFPFAVGTRIKLGNQNERSFYLQRRDYLSVLCTINE